MSMDEEIRASVARVARADRQSKLPPLGIVPIYSYRDIGVYAANVDSPEKALNLATTLIDWAAKMLGNPPDSRLTGPTHDEILAAIEAARADGYDRGWAARSRRPENVD